MLKTIIFIAICANFQLSIFASPINEPFIIPTSLEKESKASIQRGVDYLISEQIPDGSWMQSSAITGLACMSLKLSKTTDKITLRKNAIEKGRQFILRNVQKDGSIGRVYKNYTTSICLITLAIINNQEDYQVMKNARHYLLDTQIDETRLKFLKEKYTEYKQIIEILKEDNNPFLAGLEVDREKLLKVYGKYKDFASDNTTNTNPFYGGIGYGSGGPSVPDLSNTQWALEALHLTEFLDSESYGATQKQINKSNLAWDKALKFLRKVQQIPESADTTWIVPEKGNKFDGGFIYQPGSSKFNDKTAQVAKNELGNYKKEGLRSYGSMTYAGLKSMIYAKLSKDDFRIKAAMDWGKKHYTLDNNPMMGAEGHFYYIHTFTKAHSVFGDEKIILKNGNTHYWRIDVLKKLLSMQKQDGNWINERSGRWMESLPVLSTAYALLSMELALYTTNK